MPGICRLQISEQIPWMYERLCVLVPLDRSRAVRALRGGTCESVKLGYRLGRTDAGQGPNFEGGDFIPGPKLRAKLGISAVTLWRWRHDKEKRLSGRQGDQRPALLSRGRRDDLAC